MGEQECKKDCFLFIWPEYNRYYLWEITGDMILIVFNLAKHIEEKNTHVFMQILMVQEKLWQKG